MAIWHGTPVERVEQLCEEFERDRKIAVTRRARELLVLLVESVEREGEAFKSSRHPDGQQTAPIEEELRYAVSRLLEAIPSQLAEIADSPNFHGSQITALNVIEKIKEGWDWICDRLPFS